MFAGGGTLRLLGGRATKALSCCCRWSTASRAPAGLPPAHSREKRRRAVLVTFKAKTLIPRRTFADTIFRRSSSPCRVCSATSCSACGSGYQAHVPSGCWFPEQELGWEERGRHSGPPYHQHAGTGYHMVRSHGKPTARPRALSPVTPPRPVTAATHEVRPPARRQARAEHQATQAQGRECATCQQRFRTVCQWAIPCSARVWARRTGNHGGYRLTAATCPVPSAAGLCFQHYSQLFRGTAFRQQAPTLCRGRPV